MNDKPPIKVLDEETIHLIAAGEVVEGPSSVVKELVENAIDARAGRILIELTSYKGNITTIRVSDDGIGMGQDDVSLAFVPHATSKIRNSMDILSCATLGFRGEALASIAAVSQVTLITRLHEEDSGAEVVVRGGEILVAREKGAPGGTSILVEDLFFNTPVRKRFAKSLQRELAQIYRIVEGFCLSHPGTGFRLVHNGRERINALPSGDLIETVIHLFGPDLAKNLVPIAYSGVHIMVGGYISLPTLSRPHPSQIFLAINQRTVSSKPMQRAIREGYGTLLPRDRFPVVFLNISLKYHLVDINVHPAKTVVRVSNEREVCEEITGAIQETLGRSNLVPEAVVSGKRGVISASESLKTQNYPHYPVPAQEVREPAHPALMDSDRRLRQTELDTGSRSLPGRFPVMEVLGQIHAVYIVAKTGEGDLVLIDQHAAHERVLYEQVVKRDQKGPYSQELITPLILPLSPAEHALIMDAMDLLRDEGFVIEQFGKDICAIRSVPLILGRIGDPGMIRELISDLSQSGDLQSAGAREEIRRIIACKGALKAGTVCTIEQCERLIFQLGQTSNPYTCPHGRPTIVSFPRSRIDAMFRRH